MHSPPRPRESRAALEQPDHRLLGSPHFGERMAVDWLDVARFADTFGYQADVTTHVWPYRDWVIDAFNANMPFDQFITWQLAGDLLPDATRDQRLATAFNRLHRQTNEGGSVEEEFRVEYVCDRVETFGTGVPRADLRVREAATITSSIRSPSGISIRFSRSSTTSTKAVSIRTSPTPCQRRRFR